MKRYISLPTVIEAVQFDGDNFGECRQFLGGKFDDKLNHPNIITLTYTVKINSGDYIIRGIKGEFYPCKPDIFKACYQETIMYPTRMEKPNE